MLSRYKGAKLITVVIVSALFFVAAVYGAGGSFKVTADVVYGNTAKDRTRVMTVTAVADDSTATFPTLTITPTAWSDTESNSGTLDWRLTGWSMYELYVDGNRTDATEPTENSDLTIKQFSVDTLGGNGTDIVDNTAEGSTYFMNDALPMPRPIAGNLVWEISNNSSPSASVEFRLFMVPTE
uniref:Uncharacterized protein n=1 Tax=viral metagenome TaxID=1070528 RepID=A0A6H1ZLL1_9ZZZZ